MALAMIEGAEARGSLKPGIAYDDDVGHLAGHKLSQFHGGSIADGFQHGISTDEGFVMGLVVGLVVGLVWDLLWDLLWRHGVSPFIF